MLGEGGVLFIGVHLIVTHNVGMFQMCLTNPDYFIDVVDLYIRIGFVSRFVQGEVFLSVCFTVDETRS